MALPQNEYEKERARIMQENRRKMEEMGLLRQKTIMESFAPCKRTDIVHKPRQIKVGECWPASRASGPRYPARRSTRLQGVKLEEGALCELSDDDEDGSRRRTHGGLLDLMDRQGRSVQQGPGGDAEEIQREIQQIRCSSQGRGSLYDSKVGICCHFCRQKKLCGEPDCTRCQTRNADEDCIGKTDCSRCHSATGKFCRACLLIRYGGNLEEVREQMKAGTWLCPHCYEDEHPEEGWICNSSICMTRRGLRPTGIAIYDALEQGFKSVGHLLQSQLLKKGGISGLRNAPGPCGGCTSGGTEAAVHSVETAAPAAASAETSTGSDHAEASRPTAAPAAVTAAARRAGRPPKAPRRSADALPDNDSPPAAAAPAPASASAALAGGSGDPTQSDGKTRQTARPRGRPSKAAKAAAASEGLLSGVASGRVAKAAAASTQRATRANARFS